MGSESITLEQVLSQYPVAELAPVLICLIIGFLIAAFLGFRLFKLGIVLSAAGYGYTFGSVTLGTALGDVSSGVDFSIILGIASAILFALVSLKVYRAFIYLAGGLLGALLGFVIPYALLLSLGIEAVGIIVGIILAVILAVPAARLMYRIFKPYIIISTSLTGSVLAAVFTSVLLFGADTVMLGVFVLVGLVLSAVAIPVQFRINRGRDLDL